ncbi:MAG: Rpn family recombination-promoting nuclease/putative transposase [Eubacterium sp.]|nr:Rpn family recombination-promoting nuclease/putative transposase [Eubacterium sp.]
MERRNDLSFLVDNKLVVMLEHQSTVNNNMPLRFLLYAAYIYENIIDGKNVYRTRLMKIPEPEFIVIYNGRENYDKKTILKLSDAFYENKHKQLELEVRIININEDKNPEILAKSKSLEGYSKLVGVTEKLRRQGESLDEAINKALKYCIDNNFLRDFITQNYREVGSMLRTEFNLDDAKIIWRMEGIEEGIEKGREEGREEGRATHENEMIKNMSEDGFSDEVIARCMRIPVNKVKKVKESFQTA